MSRHRHSTSPLRRARFPFVLLAAAAVVAGAQIPADSVLQGFEPSGDLQVVIDGEVQPQAELFYANRARAYLVMAPELASPVLLELGSQQVGTVSLMKVVRRDGGGYDILADADIRPTGVFTVEGKGISFSVDEREVKLIQKPYLLGLKKLPDLLAHNPGYGVSARGYSPDGDALAKLRGLDGEVRVRVYFGSWCEYCKRHVPYVMRIEKELEDAGIAFEYFGLDKPTVDAGDPWPDGVKEVPTAVVYVDGKEVGRVARNQWRAPELALSRLLAGS